MLPAASLKSIAVAALLAAAPAVARTAAGQVGAPAADFTLEAYGGGTHTLSDHAGKVVLLFVVGYG
jgi:gamma-glutamyl:cysteine ligase YbdK (ATP-grasp superfamily)